jgi:glutaminyl-tRNA synthetase
MNHGSPRPAPTSERAGAAQGQDFIRTIVAEDLRRGKHDVIVTRFPPEPNGYLHIGHATAVVLNFGIAAETGGRCHLRFDDTNPETEDMIYVESAIDTIAWLGFEWGEHLYFASDYFERMYAFAEHLIREGKAYVDSLDEEAIREYRGTVTEPGRPSPYRDRSVEENLDLFQRMRDGAFADGAHILRAKLDMSSPNMLLRDPILYRIRHAEHYRSGDRWCVYPMYDFAHPIEDAIESITHSFCTLEFENNRPLYDWVVENIPRGGPVGIPPESRPRQYEFARRNFEYTVTSKRKLLQLVRERRVDGWDDPRMPTLAGLRRRGFTPEAIRSFCETIGVARTANRVDIGKLEFAIRDDLNTKAPRVLCVLNPLRVVLTNFPEDGVETLEAPFYPHDVPREGSRELPFTRVLYIDREDFREDPPKGYYRLSPGAEVRLRYAYIIRCDEAVRDEAGEIVELRCTYYPETRGGRAPGGKTIRGTIHWVSAAHALPCEVRLYDRLFDVPDPDDAAGDFQDHLNPESLVVVGGAMIEPSVRDDAPGSHYQFERMGYFISDMVDSKPGALVFNRTVTLRDTWAKGREERERADEPPLKPGPPKSSPRRERTEDEVAAHASARSKAAAAEASARDPELEKSRGVYEAEHGLTAEEADILTRERSISELFEEALTVGASAKGAANLLIHELPREVQAIGAGEPVVTGAALGDLVKLLESGTISSSGGREVLAVLLREGGSPAEIVERLGLRQISDPEALRPLVEQVLTTHPDKVREYRGGKAGLMGFFIGQVMRRSGGKANPEIARTLFEEVMG